jgi:four helix bundle protein
MVPFTELQAWQRAHSLVLEVYRDTAAFPAVEQMGLVGQLRRAAINVAASIADGSKRKSRTEHARLIGIAVGSLGQVQYLFILSRDLGYLSEDRFERLQAQAREVAKLLHAWHASVEKKTG